MDPRFGLVLPLFAAIVAAPASAQTPAASMAPAALSPTPPGEAAAKKVAPPAKPVKGPAGQDAKLVAMKPSADPKFVKTNVPRTLAEALAATYSNQPALQASRARLRATDENVPAALAGWRPTVQIQATGGYGGGFSKVLSFASANRSSIVSPLDRLLGTMTAQVTQPLYTGGRTQANVNRARNQVMAERATLIAQEQTSFTAAVNAYVGVILAMQQLDLNRNNEIVLFKQLQATNDRFRVGEITRTDVAQAEAALAGARAQRQTSEGTLETARGVFRQIVGVIPPENLVPPQPLALPLKAETEAIALAATNNPTVVAAQFTDAAAKDAVDVALAQLLPQASLQGQATEQNNASGYSSKTSSYQIIAQITVPLYQGGSEYAGVRQARQQQQQTERALDDARRTAVQNAIQAWETLTSARAATESTRAQIRANEIALEGVEREAIVGSRTTLDVLNAQQLLLNSRTSLVQNLAQVVNASYAVAAAIGRLTARDMHLPVPLYDETAYYNTVRDKWVGLGDYATNQPGR